MAKRTPNHLKLLRGSEPRYLNPGEPIPAVAEDDLTQPPRGLGAKPSAVWRRLAPDLIDKGCLTPWDVDLFGAFCVSVAQYHELRRLVQRHGVTAPGSQEQLVVSPHFRAQGVALDAMLKLAARFGLSPADRAGLVTMAVRRPGDPLGPERLLT